MRWGVFLYLYLYISVIILSFKEVYVSVSVAPEYHPQAQEVAQIHPLCHKPFENRRQINTISLILISWGKQSPAEEHEEGIGEKVGGVKHPQVGLR